MSRKIKAPETFSEAKTLGDRLRLIISQLDITAKEFAEKCGMSYKILNEYLQNRRSPGGDKLKQIAEAFNVNLNWLLTGEGSPFLGFESAEAGKIVAEKEKTEEKIVSKAEKSVEKSASETSAVENVELVFEVLREIFHYPEEERYIKLLEKVGRMHGFDILFTPLFKKKEGKIRKKIITVKDAVEAYEEIDEFFKKMKERIPY